MSVTAKQIAKERYAQMLFDADAAGRLVAQSAFLPRIPAQYNTRALRDVWIGGYLTAFQNRMADEQKVDEP